MKPLYKTDSSFLTLYNVCSVRHGMFSTSGGVQYIGGYHEYIGGYHEYIGGYHDKSGGYHEYIGGCSVHRRDIMIHVGEQLDKILSISIEKTPMY